jgi:hypothetical protein
MSKEERNTGVELGLEPEPEKGGEITPGERILRALMQQQEDIKKSCVPLLDRCAALAQKAYRRKAETPAFDFTAKLKTAGEIGRLRAEYEGFKKEIFENLNKLSQHDTTDEFHTALYQHIEMLDSYFGVKEDFGHRPLVFGGKP